MQYSEWESFLVNSEDREEKQNYNNLEVTFMIEILAHSLLCYAVLLFVYRKRGKKTIKTQENVKHYYGIAVNGIR